MHDDELWLIIGLLRIPVPLCVGWKCHTTAAELKYSQKIVVSKRNDNTNGLAGNLAGTTLLRLGHSSIPWRAQDSIDMQGLQHLLLSMLANAAVMSYFVFRSFLVNYGSYRICPPPEKTSYLRIYMENVGFEKRIV
ncbi:hypothetical protein TNCV_3875901 [Trichonephila clavipes]|uniref:Uncharacterized protein n=1 Tax=Trichonephila clavipes TaxID=2585209 RepID=A0A8X6SRZ8_TRICX|nr:hypothetical protein TNCV_3875901 [Trichonephila clavipes]